MFLLPAFIASLVPSVYKALLKVNPLIRAQCVDLLTMFINRSPDTVDVSQVIIQVLCPEPFKYIGLFNVNDGFPDDHIFQFHVPAGTLTISLVSAWDTQYLMVSSRPVVGAYSVPHTVDVANRNKNNRGFIFLLSYHTTL
jgi:hypothetical protein